MIKFSFAVNSNHQFELKHFGDADKFLIYQRKEGKLTFEEEEKNQYKEMQHGSQEKGKAIIDLLKSKGVHVLVSRQFGKNIAMVNQHFVPIIVSGEKPGEICAIIEKHFAWIQEEVENKTENYNLFTIKNSVLKSEI